MDKEYHTAYVRWYRRYGPNSIRRWLVEYKKTLHCEQCPETHSSCLDFHHRNRSTKNFDINHFIHKAANNEKTKIIILAEIEKCVVLCANCHRKEHFLQTEMTRALNDAKWRTLFDNITPQEWQNKRNARLSEHMKQLWQTPDYRQARTNDLNRYNEECRKNPELIKERARRISEGHKIGNK